MKAWDTNVVIRHLTEDDPQHLKIARKELTKSERRGEPIWVSLLVIIETAWVLSQYNLRDPDSWLKNLCVFLVGNAVWV